MTANRSTHRRSSAAARARAAGDGDARRAGERVPPPRSGRRGQRHRVVGRDQALARRADVCGRRIRAAACAFSTRRRRALPSSMTCRSWGWSKASGPSGRAATSSIRARLIAQLEPSRPERVELNAERDHARWARAAFRDLVGLARLRDAAFDLCARIRRGGRAVVVHRRCAVVRRCQRSVNGHAATGLRVFADEALVDDPARCRLAMGGGSIAQRRSRTARAFKARRASGRCRA